jgi:hypothetical protein
MTEHEWESTDRAFYTGYNDFRHLKYSHFHFSLCNSNHGEACFNEYELNATGHILWCSQFTQPMPQAYNAVISTPPVSIRFYDIHNNMPSTPKWYLPLRLSDQNRICSSMRAICLTDSIHLHLITLLPVWNISQCALPSQSEAGRDVITRQHKMGFKIAPPDVSLNTQDFSSVRLPAPRTVRRQNTSHSVFGE